MGWEIENRQVVALKRFVFSQRQWHNRRVWEAKRTHIRSFLFLFFCSLITTTRFDSNREENQSDTDYLRLNSRISNGITQCTQIQIHKKKNERLLISKTYVRPSIRRPCFIATAPILLIELYVYIVFSPRCQCRRHHHHRRLLFDVHERKIMLCCARWRIFCVPHRSKKKKNSCNLKNRLRMLFRLMPLPQSLLRAICKRNGL